MTGRCGLKEANLNDSRALAQRVHHVIDRQIILGFMSFIENFGHAGYETLHQDLILLPERLFEQTNLQNLQPQQGGSCDHSLSPKERSPHYLTSFITVKATGPKR